MNPSDQILEHAERNQILDDAEQRAAQMAVGSSVQIEQAQALDETKRAVRADLELAKKGLPTIEYAIRKDIKPFVARILGTAQRANVAVKEIAGPLNELEKLCQDIPRQMRDGIRAVDELTFRHIAGTDRHGKPGVDHNKQQDWIAGIRQILKSHDGVLSRMRNLQGQIETFIRENDWPR